MNALFLNSAPCGEEYESKYYKEEIEKSTEAITNWEAGEYASKLALPSGMSQETKGLHPIMYAIIRTLSKVIEETNKESNRDHILREQLLPRRTEKEANRWIDLFFNFEEENSAAIVEYANRVSVEAKPLSRANEDYFKLTQQGVHQEIGHISRDLIAAFNFMGVETDRKGTGLVVTIVSV
jgi:hypothetical protein